MSYTCDTCHRIGTEDDGIAGGGDRCPDDECGGTVHSTTTEEAIEYHVNEAQGRDAADGFEAVALAVAALRMVGAGIPPADLIRIYAPEYYRAPEFYSLRLGDA